jgi:hypothetical protein
MILGLPPNKLPSGCSIDREVGGCDGFAGQALDAVGHLLRAGLSAGVDFVKTVWAEIY